MPVGTVGPVGLELPQQLLESVSGPDHDDDDGDDHDDDYDGDDDDYDADYNDNDGKENVSYTYI